VQHGLYGSLLQGLGVCVGALGAVPCCPFPNPFMSVQQGASFRIMPCAHLFTHTRSAHRLRRPSIALWTVLQGDIVVLIGLGELILTTIKSVDPGLVNVNVCTEELKRVDIKVCHDVIDGGDLS
jgi:erythrocyte band 7 integral membrane protein